MYEGVTLDCGLKGRNGEIVTEPDISAIKQQAQTFIEKINSGKQPARIARERAFEALKASRRR